MKVFRYIIIYLIIALACSPAFAYYCATDCAADLIVNGNNIDSIAISHTFSLVETPSESESTSDALPCAMGVACCHLFQATPASSTTEPLALDTSNVFPHRYIPSGKSAELSPPLKPPA